MSKMRAMVIRGYGGPEVFEEAELPCPEVGVGQVRVKISATSYNPLESKIRAGFARLGPDLPAVLNSDLSGVIDQVGAGVKGFREGDSVFACSGGIKGRQGALAEYALVDAAVLAKAPTTLDLAECAALPIGFITSWYALCRKTRVREGQRVLVSGGTGGVGHVGVQLATALGAEVHATVSSEEKARRVLELGAVAAIDRRSQGPADYVASNTEGVGFDLVFDTVGGVSLDHAFAAARHEGDVVTINARTSHDLTPAHSRGQSLHFVMMLASMLKGEDLEHYGEILTEAARLVDDGRLRPLIDAKRFDLWDVADAHHYAATGAAVGKILLTI